MMRRRLFINLTVFFALSVALVLYGFISLIGNPLRSPTTVSSVFADASGINPHFAVQLNGVDVGSVTGVHLVANGALVQMAINPGVSVTGTATASVDVANDLGEQVVELTPRLFSCSAASLRRHHPVHREHPGRRRQGGHRGGEAPEHDPPWRSQLRAATARDRSRRAGRQPPVDHRVQHHFYSVSSFSTKGSSRRCSRTLRRSSTR